MISYRGLSKTLSDFLNLNICKIQIKDSNFICLNVVVSHHSNNNGECSSLDRILFQVTTRLTICYLVL